MQSCFASEMAEIKQAHCFCLFTPYQTSNSGPKWTFHDCRLFVDSESGFWGETKDKMALCDGAQWKMQWKSEVK